MKGQKKNLNWVKWYCLISFSLISCFVQFTIYRFFIQVNIQQYWVAIPLVWYVFLYGVNKYIVKLYNVAVSIEISGLFALLLIYIFVQNSSIYVLIDNKYQLLSFFICILFFINLAIARSKKEKETVDQKSNCPNHLFNLFYLNTSKAHEIAMLIDNKIMKTIEKEQVSEVLLKHNTSILAGKKDSLASEMGYSLEDSSKKRVYENFDVKTTKSIMLRKIYETALNNKNESLEIGDLVIFDNIELRQRNIDDTIMILNVLQDSKIKNQGNDDLEINLNKMMEKMLNDFTIDYTFSYKWKENEEKKYLIQLPYKSSENFENGYQHNDLQLGKLSLIGIYRGEIDFSKRESISSKFLEIMTKSYNNGNSYKVDKTEKMKLSYEETKTEEYQFDFTHQKLEGKFCLIDVIAVIQELNIDKEKKNENNAIHI
ncbi:MAG: hypothetical protein Q4D45_00140 [Lachnospiraceae bacterium]|nr:hypothetical protein [Lachnospiraceae bacterium]